MTTQALPYITIVGFMFGSTLVASRFSVGQYHPSTYIGLRLVIASLAHLVLYRLFQQRYTWPRDRRLWQHAIILGVMGTAVPMTAIVSSLQYLSSGIAAIMITTGPAITVILAHFFLGDEPLTRIKAFGVLLAFGGTIMLAFTGESGIPDIDRANPVGYLLLSLAILLSSIASIYIRKYLNDYRAYDVASIRMFTAALVVMPLSIIFVGFDLSQVTTTGYAALIYAALVGTFSGFLLMVYNIKRFGATAAAMTGYIIPVVAGIGGVIFLGEQITMVMVAGMILIISGVAIINRGQKKKIAPTSIATD